MLVVVVVVELIGLVVELMGLVVELMGLVVELMGLVVELSPTMKGLVISLLKKLVVEILGNKIIKIAIETKNGIVFSKNRGKDICNIYSGT